MNCRAVLPASAFLGRTAAHATKEVSYRHVRDRSTSEQPKGSGLTVARRPNMGRKDKAPPLTKRKIKTERRCRRWQTFQRRRRLLGFDDVPQAERPRLATQRTPIALSLRSIEGWSAPRALKERLAADGASLECALSLSFFDCASRRFFGV